MAGKTASLTIYIFHRDGSVSGERNHPRLVMAMGTDATARPEYLAHRQPRILGDDRRANRFVFFLP